jgi:hypothetical protein
MPSWHLVGSSREQLGLRSNPSETFQGMDPQGSQEGVGKHRFVKSALIYSFAGAVGSWHRKDSAS